MKGAILASVGLAAGLLGACAGGSDSSPDGRVYGRTCTPGGTFDLNGRHAVLGTLNVHVNASGLVEVDTTAELIIAMDAVQSGTGVQVLAEACAIKIPGVPIQGQDKPIQFEVQEVTIASVEHVDGDATLSSPSATCARFETETFRIVIGARVDDGPLGDTAPLPAADAEGDFRACPPTADTPCRLAIGANCACDQEGDGLPGATLLASNVPAVNLDRVYVVLRTLFALDGEVFSSDEVRGTINAGIELGILGCRIATGGPCNAAEVGAVKNLNPAITQQPGNPSKFVSARVPDGMTCAEILANRDTLFPR
jgi:hypothetical protein